jgi:hypothetical protein
MSKRRMLSLQIVDTDAFLEMPTSTQALYFHLVMRADDEGFVSNPKKIMKLIGVQEDDIKILIAKRFILIFESGIVVIKHWLIHNTIRMDRLNKTTYQKEKEMLKVCENKAYSENGNQMATRWQPDGNQMAAQVKLDQVKLSKVKITVVSTTEENENAILNANKQIAEIINIFKQINPTIDFGHKTNRRAAEELIKQFGFEKTHATTEYAVSIQGKQYAPTITTPYQLKIKLGDLMIYHKKESNSEMLIL